MFGVQLAKTLFIFPKNVAEIYFIHFSPLPPPPDLTLQVREVWVEANSPLQLHTVLYSLN